MARLSGLQTEYTEAVRTVQDQKHLITQLEEDLRSVNALSSMFRGDAEVHVLYICHGFIDPHSLSSPILPPTPSLYITQLEEDLRSANDCHPRSEERLRGDAEFLYITQLEEDLRSVNALSSHVQRRCRGTVYLCRSFRSSQSLLSALQPPTPSLYITQLEKDLRSANDCHPCSEMGEPGPNQVKDPGSEVMVEVMKDAIPQADLTSTAANSLLPIVQSQRERYRLRAKELEMQSLGQQQQVTILQNEIDKLRSDNVKLYEKIRFLQSYPSQSKAGNEDAESRYSTQYEDKLDPFSTFSKKERTRKYMNLKPYDKITLSMGRFIMGNKVARTIAFFYTILLHSLVFLVLYKLAHTESCKRDLAVECHNQFADHMLKVHGNKEFHMSEDKHQ
ncbi:protein CASP-like [Gigantopelta aegis]|uniref:protein CASP-like n=1 Tax=Gigantopelta aegis TaxID=1735272 RepID=UPI001B88B917|nr:protein CASP-like [Gigantopelta aegis]